MKKNGHNSTRAARRRLVAAFVAVVAVFLCGAASAGAASTIGTAASSQEIGETIHDTAALTGVTAEAKGTITFTAWGPSDNPDCSGAPVFTSTVNVNGPASNYVSANFTPSTAGDYYWIASYSGDVNNLPASGACGDPGETSILEKKFTLVATGASSQTVGNAVHDIASLAIATPGAGGSITFNLYGPSASPNCSGAAVFTSTVPVSGPGPYQSGDFTPTTAGSYYWVASYSGDVNNLPSGGSCGDGGETSTIGKETTLLATAGSSGTIGDAAHDVATLSGATASSGGTITFNLYGPSASPNCSGAVVFTSTVNVNGSGEYGSGNFTPSTAGSYYWIASYSGDGNNLPSSGSCGDAAETSVLAKRPTLLATAASSQTIGAAVRDTATLSGATANSGGTITFNAWGPSDSFDCSGAPVFTSTVPVSGNGNYQSADFTPSTAGKYYWIASYSGDVNNLPSSGSCGDSGEMSTLGGTAPTLGTVASGEVVTGGKVKDTAALAGGFNPTGEIEFALYGPGDPTCFGSPAFSGSTPVAGDGTYDSPEFTPTTPGTYTWSAEYTGDANNLPIGSCGGPGETVTVAEATPTITTQSSPEVHLGGTITDKATLSGGRAPSGSIVFRAYGPDDTACSGTPAFTSDPVSVTGNGDYTSPAFTPMAAGAYRWTATYSGDANNEPAAGSCNDANESVTVAPAEVVTPTEPATTPPTKPAPVAPPICTPIEAAVGNYVPGAPTTTTSPATPVPGVRARLKVPQPSDQQIHATLHFQWNGKPRTLDLGDRTLGNPSTRNLRLALPATWSKRLPLGTKVVLSLQVTSTPWGSNGCLNPTTSQKTLHTRVVKVLGG